MDGNKFDIFCIYSENDEGTLDELVVDIFNKEYEYTGNVDGEELSFNNNCKIKQFKVERNFFDYYCDLLEKAYSGSCYVNEDDYETRKKHIKLGI